MSERASGDLLVYLDPSRDLPAPGELAAEEKRALDELDLRVTAARDLAEVLRLALDTLRPHSPCDRISVAFLDRDEARVVSHETLSDYEPRLLREGYVEELEGSSLAEVIRSGRLRVIRDLERYLEAKPESRSTKLLVREGVRSNLTCPLVVDGRRVGFLFRSSRQPDAYTRHHARLHLATVERLAHVIEKAWRIEQLDTANRAYTEVLAFVSHELKAPVASMVSTADVLAEGYVGPVSDKQRDKLRSIVLRGEFLLGMVRDYLDLARLEGGELVLRPDDRIDLSGVLLERALEVVGPQIDAAKMSLERHVEGTPRPLRADPNLLRIVLVNFLGNAAKYGREGGLIRVLTRYENEEVRFAVRNEGPGFPADQRGRLFQRFSRLETPELRRRKGTGIGLYTCWRIVRMHQGRVFANSEEGSWAEFGFTMPYEGPAGGLEEPAAD